MLRTKPSLTLAKIAKRCAVSIAYVSKLNDEMDIRPPGHKGDLLSANQFEAMARQDLLESARTYDTSADRALLFDGYRRAATRLLDEHKPDRAA
jgi:hypothetical protein